MFADCDEKSVIYCGENKYGRCAEVYHDYIQCQRFAIDKRVECKWVKEDYVECITRKKQSLAYHQIKEAMTKDKTFIHKVIRRLFQDK